MKRPKARKGPSETSGRRPPQTNPDVGRTAPRLVLVAGFEELLHGRIEAETHEDELRLVASLVAPAARGRILAAVEDLLDELAGRSAA
jgi:hypothetical protein